jgi:hypothetical protein
MTDAVKVENDTWVFYAMQIEGSPSNIELRKGTPEAITRDGFATEPNSGYCCPHQWIDERGYVDLELSQKYPYAHAQGAEAV